MAGPIEVAYGSDAGRRSDSSLSTGAIEGLAIFRDYMPHNSTVLEVGCGLGHFSGVLIRNGNKLTAIDISPEAISHCKSKFGNKADFFVADILSFSPGKKFGFAILNGVLDQIEGDEKALSMVFSSLEKKGKMLLAVPVSKQRYISFSVHHYTEQEILLKIKKAGFVAEKVVRRGGALSYLASALSKKIAFPVKFLSMVRKLPFYRAMFELDAKAGFKGDVLLFICAKP